MKQSAENLRAIVAATEAQAVNVQRFLKIMKKYNEPTELTPAILWKFMEKVVVHASDKSSGHGYSGLMCITPSLGRLICSQSTASTRKRQLYDAFASCSCLSLEKLLYQGSPQALNQGVTEQTISVNGLMRNVAEITARINPARFAVAANWWIGLTATLSRQMRKWSS